MGSEESLKRLIFSAASKLNFKKRRSRNFGNERVNTRMAIIWRGIFKI